MSLSFENILLIGSTLIILSIIATKSTKFGIPSLILFLMVGMLAGSDGIGGIHFYDLYVSKFIGIVALIAILFSGGLDTRFADIKPVLRNGILLSTLGVILTAGIVGFFVYKVTGLSFFESLLLGSIISSTDAASVFSILRSKNAGLKGNIRPLLEFESGSNDPMAYFLTILFLFLIKNNDTSAVNIIILFLKQFIIGGLLGFAIGYVVHRTINFINLNFEGLYSVLLIAFAAFSFAVSDFLGGNGFLTVYLTALYLGNKDFIHKRSLIKHFDGQAWLMQIIVFLTLGLLVFPKQLVPLIGVGLGISLFLIFVARPIVIFLVLHFSNLNTRAKFFISWVGLRGAVPIILAIYVLDSRIPNASFIFNLVFFISVMSVLVQGSTIPFVAKWLHLAVPVSVRKKSTLDSELANRVKSILVEVEVAPDSKCIDKSIIDLHIPQGVVISMINRNNSYIIPEGKTQIKNGDKVTIMAESIDTLNNFYRNAGLKTK